VDQSQPSSPSPEVRQTFAIAPRNSGTTVPVGLVERKFPAGRAPASGPPSRGGYWGLGLTILSSTERVARNVSRAGGVSSRVEKRHFSRRLQ
jgi:hypothetical protein